MTAEQALMRLGSSTMEAIQGVLESFAPGTVSPGHVRPVAAGEDPFADIHVPAIAADVSYVDGVTGGNVLVIGIDGARRLAAAMMGMDPMSVEPGGDLDEIGFSAVGEAANQMMSAAAMATSKVLGDEVEIAPPDVRRIESPEEASAAWVHTGQATAVTFTVCGVQALLVQLVPHAFIVRMTRAFDEMTAEYESAPLGDALRDVSVRVWAELGRTRMPSAAAVALGTGAVVELDADVEEPVELYADGMRFAAGKLVVCEDGTLAVRIETLFTHPSDPIPTPTPTLEV